MSNNFDTNLLIDSGTGTAAAPGDYIGFGRAAGGVVSTGPRIYALTDSPNGVLTAPRGSLVLRTTLGSVQLWQNSDGGTTWGNVGALAAGVIDLPAATDAALLFAVGATPYMRFRTSATPAIEFAVDLDWGSRDGVDIDVVCRNASATATQFLAGLGGTVLLGFNTAVAGEGLYSAAAQLATTANTFSVVPADNQAAALRIAETDANTWMITFDTRNGTELVGFGADLDFVARNVPSFANVLNGNATAFEFRAGAGGTVLLGMNTNVAGEGLYSAVAAINTTAALQWTLIDATAAGLSIGATGALDMMTFDTGAGGPGTEGIYIGALGGMRLNDAVDLRFGSPGTDVVFTPDGTGMTITATGDIAITSDVDFQWGTATPYQIRERFDAGNNRLDYLGANVNGLAALANSSAFRWTTGARITTDAAVGTGSGVYEWFTGGTDNTNAGGTAGPTGTFTWTSGSSTASGGGTAGGSGGFAWISGNTTNGAAGTGGFAWTSGNATAGAGNSGGFTFTSGTSFGGARGDFTADVRNLVLTLSGGTIDVDAQATMMLIRDNTDASFVISEAGNPYFEVDTRNGVEIINLGNVTTNPDVTHVGIGDFTHNDVGIIATNGIDHGTRMVVVEDFSQRPLLAASIAADNASKRVEVFGTNSADANTLFYVGGGISLLTAGGAGDQECVRGNTVGADNSQCPLTGTTWSTADLLVFKANLQVVDIANTTIGAGLKLTLNAGATLFDNATDANQAYFGYASDNRYGGVAANWHCVFRTGGASANVDTGVAANPGNYRLVITTDAARLVRFYLNGALVATTVVAIGVANLLPFVGIEQPGAGGGRTMVVQRMTVSKIYT